MSRDPSDIDKVGKELEKLEEDIQNLLLQDPQQENDGTSKLSPSSVEKEPKRSSRAKSIRKGLGKLLSRSSKQEMCYVTSTSETVEMTIASATDLVTELSGSSDVTPTSLATDLTGSIDISCHQSSNDDNLDRQTGETQDEDTTKSPLKKSQWNATLEAATFDIEAFVSATKSDLEMQASSISEDSKNILASPTGGSSVCAEDSQINDSEIYVTDPQMDSQNDPVSQDEEESENANQHDDTQQSVSDVGSERVLRSFFSSWIDKSSKKKKPSRRSFLGRRSSKASNAEDSMEAIESVETCREILSSVSFSRENKLTERAAQRESKETNEEKLLRTKIERIYNAFRTQQQKRTQLKYAVFSWLLKNGTTLYAFGGDTSSSNSSSTASKDNNDTGAIIKARPKTEQDVLDAGLKVVQMRVDDLCRALNIRSKQQMNGFKHLLMARLKRLEQPGCFLRQDRQLTVSNETYSVEHGVSKPSDAVSESHIVETSTFDSTMHSIIHPDEDLLSSREEQPDNSQTFLITQTNSADAEGFNVVYETCSNLCGTEMAIEAAPAATLSESVAKQEEGNAVDESSSILQKFSEVDAEGDAALLDALVQLLSTSQEEAMGKEVQLSKIESNDSQCESLNIEHQRQQKEKEPVGEVNQGETPCPKLAERQEIPGGNLKARGSDADGYDFDIGATMANIKAMQPNVLDSLLSLFCLKEPSALPREVDGTPVTSVEAPQESSEKLQEECKLDGTKKEEANKSVPLSTLPNMTPVVPFQKSPSEFLQIRNQSRLSLKVRRSSSAPLRRGSEQLLPSVDSEEEDIFGNRDKKNSVVLKESVAVEQLNNDRESNSCNSLAIKMDNKPQNVEEKSMVVHEQSPISSVAQTKKQGSKRIKTKRKRRSKRKSSRNLLGRSFLAPITEHVEESASKPSEDSLDNPKVGLNDATDPQTTQDNDEVALVVSYKLEDASFSTFDERNPTVASALSGERNESNELLQELTKSSSEDPKLFLSSDDTHSSYDAESVNKEMSEDCDLGCKGDGNGSTSTGNEDELNDLSSNDTGSAKDKTLGSVDLSHTLSESTGSTYSARTNSVGSSHSSGTVNGGRTNSLGSSHSSGTDNGDSVWSPCGFRSESSSGTESEDFGSGSRTFESTITSECNDGSYDDDRSDQDETVGEHSAGGSFESSLTVEEKNDGFDNKANSSPNEVENPIKDVIPINKNGAISQSKTAPTKAAGSSSPRKLASRGSFFKSKRVFGRKSRKEVDCTVEADVGSVGHTVLEVYIPQDGEVSKEGSRLRIPSPKKIATILRKSAQKKLKQNPSFMPPKSPSQQSPVQMRDDEEMLRGQSTIDSREMESRDTEVNSMIPMPQSLVRF